MSNTIAQILNHQHAPKILFRFPRMIFVYYILNRITALRMKYVHRAIRISLKTMPAPKRIVEAGCGMGDFLFTQPALRNAPHALGIDVSQSNIELCQKLADAIGATNMSFLCSDLSKAELPPDQDLILCIGVLMYIKEDETVLTKFHTALSANGKLLIYIAVNYRRTLSLYKHLSRRTGFDYDDIIGRPHTYTDQSLEHLLTKCGFTIEHKEHSFGKIAATLFEISSIFEWVFKTVHPLISLLMLPLYIPFYLLYLLSMEIDYFSRRNTGNGVMIIAKKTHA